ncbi:MAG: hypothetical protein Tsb0014_34430 [Pleurocapsa sp.]
MTEKIVLNKAKNLGFICRLSEEKSWQIFHNRPQETWKLTSVNSRWILSIKNIPQLYLNPEEAIAFLTTRARNRSKSD